MGKRVILIFALAWHVCSMAIDDLTTFSLHYVLETSSQVGLEA